MKMKKKKVNHKRTKKSASNPDDHKHREVLKFEKDLLKKEQKLYKFGFWLLFFVTLSSVLFSIWSISSIYSNFRTVTKILDDSFERTNLIMDISTSKISSCQSELANCQNGSADSTLAG
ncbi:hypothetical protein KY362_05830 [Candidatus Woesearchaeota archaeon]|nr:hypothetical protein [Candidatus Woesearchaeota archaeon]